LSEDTEAVSETKGRSPRELHEIKKKSKESAHFAEGPNLESLRKKTNKTTTRGEKIKKGKKKEAGGKKGS